MQFVEIDNQGNTTSAGYAPYLDYRPLDRGRTGGLSRRFGRKWESNPPGSGAKLESKAMEHAADCTWCRASGRGPPAQGGLDRQDAAAVKERLTKEINYWDHRAAQLKEQELAGRVNARLNSGLARQRADDLTARLQKRWPNWNRNAKISPLPPVVLGGAMIVPLGLLRQLQGADGRQPPTFAPTPNAPKGWPWQAVMEPSGAWALTPRDVSAENLGYDVESAVPGTGRLRFIEVKGRIAGEPTTVTITKNEILTALNKPEDFILAIGLIDGEEVDLHYVRQPFEKEPDFNATSVNYALPKLLAGGGPPS
jgi:hypothetical protein